MTTKTKKTVAFFEHTIATVRLSSDRRTRDFVAAQRANNRSNPSFLRILKRAIAHEVFKFSPGTQRPGQHR